jgi:hypothetical protein
MADLESAIAQWRRGERRLEQAPAERARTLERIVDAIVAELRRRLGGRFRARELSELYARGTSWCLQLAMQKAPEDAWSWDGAIVVDAAFGRYLREAVDYAGGRLIVADGQGHGERNASA